MSEENTNETTEVTDLDRVIAIIEPMIEDGAEDDAMVVAVIQAGFKFAKAGKLVVKALESKGLRMSAKDRYESAKELLLNWEFAPEDWSDVQGAADAIADEIDATTKAQAISCIKRFAKEMSIEMPEKPKKASGGPRIGVFDRFSEWALQNKDATSDEVAAYAASVCDSEKQAAKYAGRFEQFIDLARRWNA